jgi:hypothetical protein
MISRLDWDEKLFIYWLLVAHRALRGLIGKKPHGSQFTIIEDVPKNRLAIRIRKPPLIDRETVLKSLKFDPSWVEILPQAALRSGTK